jgi:hypothetical protein
MNIAAIDKAFAEMIAERGIHKKLGIESNYVTQLRYKLKHPEATNGISLDTKLELLRKSGWKESSAKFSREELVDAVRFTLRQGEKAKEWGPEYIVEKWEAKK